MVDDEDDRLVEHPPQPLVGDEDASGLDVRDLRSDGREEKEEGGVRDASSGDGEGRNGNRKSGNVKFQMRNGVRNAAEMPNTEQARTECPHRCLLKFFLGCMTRGISAAVTKGSSQDSGRAEAAVAPPTASPSKMSTGRAARLPRWPEAASSSSSAAAWPPSPPPMPSWCCLPLKMDEMAPTNRLPSRSCLPSSASASPSCCRSPTSPPAAAWEEAWRVLAGAEAAASFLPPRRLSRSAIPSSISCCTSLARKALQSLPMRSSSSRSSRARSGFLAWRAVGGGGEVAVAVEDRAAAGKCGWKAAAAASGLHCISATTGAR